MVFLKIEDGKGKNEGKKPTVLLVALVSGKTDKNLPSLPHGNQLLLWSSQSHPQQEFLNLFISPRLTLHSSCSSHKDRRVIFLWVSEKVWSNGRCSCFIHFYFHS
jgi:hypothetical protein